MDEADRDPEQPPPPRASPGAPPDDRELWQAVLRTAVDPIVVIDQEGIVVLANEATERLLGYPVDELVGRNVDVLMPEPHRSRHDGYLARYLSTGEATIIGIGREVEARRADGTVFPVSLAVSEIRLDGRSWFTGIIHDLTKRRQVETELRTAKESLEERVRERTARLETSLTELARSNRDLEQFAYIASHDLQTPLRNIRQGLELLDEHLDRSPLASGWTTRPGRAAEPHRRLPPCGWSEIIQGLLSYARLGRGGDPPGHPVGLTARGSRRSWPSSWGQATVGRVQRGRHPHRRRCRPIDRRRGPAPPAPPEPAGERPTSTADHGPSRSTSWSTPGAGRGRHVADLGRPTTASASTPSSSQRVFELFRRAHAGYEGVGLGLAICQRIVERHGGDIWVEAGAEGGSVFHFTVPDMPDEATGPGGAVAADREGR